MSGPSMFCGKHPVGSPRPCEGCESARRAHRERIAEIARANREAAENQYESFLRAHASDALHVAFLAAGADRSDKNEPITGSVRNVGLTVAVKLNVEPRRGVSDSFFDLRDALVDVSHPEHVRGLRVEIKDGSVVVELHGHGAEPTEASR